jgi:hypothetical protein
VRIRGISSSLSSFRGGGFCHSVGNSSDHRLLPFLICQACNWTTGHVDGMLDQRIVLIEDRMAA